jgi:hypothetical protein
LTISVKTISEIQEIGNLTRTIYEHPLVVSNASLIAALNITKMHRNMKDVVLSKDEWEIITHLENVNRYENIVYRQLDTIKEDILGDAGQQLERETRTLFDEWKPIRNEVLKSIQTGKHEYAVNITQEKGAKHVELLEKKMMELTYYARNKAAEFIDSANTKQSKFESFTKLITALSVFFTTLIAVFSTVSFRRSRAKLIDEKAKLTEALNEIKTLKGIIPICAHCKKIRDDEGIWNLLEEYIDTHSDASLSHGICPDCMKKYYGKYLDKSVFAKC